jgi:cobalt-zinc-cadmium efflux system outer membrane protein
VSRYFDPVQGLPAAELVRRALQSNPELAAARLQVERVRARLGQAALRPNPTLDFEHATGRYTGSSGERDTTIGLSLPIELGGKRQRRIELARLEVEAAEVELADHERRLAGQVHAALADALAALSELDITENLNTVDLQTARIVEARVSEGDSAPIELNLLRVEVDRLRARRALAEGRLEAALLQLKSLIGLRPGDPLLLGDELRSPALADPTLPPEGALDIALRSRPDLKLARLNEEAAQAGLRLARAEAMPDLTAFGKYTVTSTRLAGLSDRDKLVAFGVSISLPVFSRNQGARAEAEVAINQARRRREFVEAMVRAEVAAAYARYRAAETAASTFERDVLARSNQNIHAIRRAYEIGAFRVTDLLVEQRRFIESRREFIEALAERYRALADLHTALGTEISSPKGGEK